MKSNRTHVPDTLFCLLLLLLVFIPVSAGAAGTDRDTVTLSIIHTNDFHGYLLPYEDRKLAPPPEKIGGAACITTIIKELRARNPRGTLILDAGDIAQGTPLSNEFRGIPVTKYMDMLPFDATTLGNHEFDWGQANLRKIRDSETFPCLCANIINRKTGEVPDFVVPFKVFEREGIKIGIIGVTTPTLPSISYPENIKDLSFIEPEEPVKNYMAQLHDRGVQVIGILSHLGVEKDKKLAEAVPGISFITGGHSHTVLKEGLMVGDTLITQTGAYGMYVGHTEMKIQKKSGKILIPTLHEELIPVIDRNVQPDREVEAMLEAYHTRIRAIMDEVLGTAETDIPKTPSPGRADSPLGNLITDLLKKETGADIFIHNTGGLRAPIDKGPITKEEIYRVLPFEDYAMSAILTGAQVQEILIHGISQEKYVQVSGVTMVVEGGKGENRKLKEVKLTNGSLLEPEKHYRVGTINFLFFGGDGYTSFLSGKERFYSKILTREMIYEAVRKRKTLEAPSDCRIIVLDACQKEAHK
jgi:2',3'-cyclic-nucleotide 2'-phosphodiesterase (5'-nucleotidase family)